MPKKKSVSQLSKLRQKLLQNLEQDDNGCWNWCLSQTGGGYGQLIFEGKRIYAHRASWEVHKGPIPIGLWVLHKCDNPACANPSHLFIGTVDDNAKDMVSKGRHYLTVNPELAPIGELNGRSKLSEVAVRYIKSHYRPRHPKFGRIGLANKFKVSTQTIYLLLSGQSWRHVG